MKSREVSVTYRTLVLGGARSGKSAHAEGLLTGHTANYLATARHDDTNPAWEARIAAHVARRPPNWHTVEVADPADLAGRLAAFTEADPPALVDDVATWLTSVLDDAGAWEGDPAAAAEVDRRHAELVSAVAGCRCRLVLVAAEVGLGVVPSTRSGSLFRDELGSLNADLAQVCEEVLLLVAGIPLRLRAAAAFGDAAHSKVHAEEVRIPVTAHSEGMEDAAMFAPVSQPDEHARREAVARQEQLTKPAGSLGRIEELGVWVTACQGTCPPRPFTRMRVVVFAGDHGVAANGVSAYPSEVTGQMVANFLTGGAAVNVLAGVAGASVRVADICVATDTADVVSGHKVRRGSGSIDRTDAMSHEETLAALAAGKAIADEEVDGGADLLIAGDMGIGNTTPAATLIAVLTGTEPVAVVGRGSGIDDAAWMRKAAAIRDARRRAVDVRYDPVALLRTAGGPDIAAMAAFLAQAAVRRTPVVLDGVVVGAAAAVAESLAPGARDWWVAGHRSAEPAHLLALDLLNLEPLLELDMRLGEGAGAVAALPLVVMAARLLGEMATFGDAGVAGPAEDRSSGPSIDASPAADTGRSGSGTEAG